MKSLQDYITAEQTKLFDECGVFFAFSREQFLKGLEKNYSANPALNDDDIYVALGDSMYAPKKFAQEVKDRLNAIAKAGIEQDLAENGKRKIIWRELNNHEASYTGDIEDTFDSLEGYGITREEVQEVFPAYMKHCIDNDLI